MICFSTKTYGKFSRLLLILFTSLLVFVLISTEAVNEANSWIDFGFFSLQPSEFIKVITIVWLSYYYDKKSIERSNSKAKKKEEPDLIKSLIPYVICIAPAALIFLQPDLGTTIIFILIVVLIFTASPIDKEVKKKIYFLLAAAVIGVE